MNLFLSRFVISCLLFSCAGTARANPYLSEKMKSWEALDYQIQKLVENVNALASSGNTESYEQVSEIWKDLYSKNRSLRDLYELNKQRWAESESSHDSLSEEQKENSWNEANKKVLEKYAATRLKLSGLFLDVSNRRATIMQEMIGQKDAKLFEWSLQYYNDIVFEILVIPQKWIGVFETRLQKIKKDVQRGPSGWIQILKELLTLFIFFAVGFFSYQFPSKIAAAMDTKRKQYLRRVYRDKTAHWKALWIERTLPYMPWIGFLIFVVFSESLFKQSYFSEFSILFPYLKYYIYYRLIRILVSQLLSSHAVLGSYAILKSKKKILKTSKNLALYFFVSLCLLHSARSSVGEGFLFLWIEYLVTYLTVFVLAMSAFTWRSEFLEISKKRFTGKPLRLFEILFSGIPSILLALPGCLIVISIILLQRLYNWSERFEFVRSLSAEIFRKKVEGLSKKETPLKKPLPLDYSDHFTKSSDDLSQIQLKGNQEEIYAEITSKVRAWNKEESQEHMYGIVGEQGSGKTTLLRKLEATAKNENIPCIYANVVGKVASPQALDSLVGALGETKSVVILDSGQNFFLSKVGGFEGFKSFLRYTQAAEKNIFWCVCFNDQSWQFLQAVMNKSRYFNEVYRLKKWSEEDLKDLITHHHHQTGFSRTYGKVLMANSSDSDIDSVDYVESKYFRLLWEESLGNPSVAKKVWLDSLSYFWGDSVVVGIPRDRTDSISGLPDDFYFVLAAIVRHENLTIEEIVDVSNLSEDLIVNAIKNCCEKGFVSKSQGRYHLTPLWQHSVYSTLLQKNFIYG